MADFTPAEEVERILVAPREKAEKAVRDFFREEWVEEPGLTKLSEDLVVVEVLMDMEESRQAVEAVVVTLVEAVEMVHGTPVEEGEDLSTQEQINKTSVATTKLVMVM